MTDPFTTPSEVEPLPPAFPALFAGECSRCLAFFAAGDLIRADSCGDWECAEHEEASHAR